MDWSGTISPFRRPRSQSQPAQERCRGSGLLLSRKRWCSAGASSSVCASSRNESRSKAYSAVLVSGRPPASYPDCSEHFSVGPPPNRTCDFHRVRLSSVVCFAMGLIYLTGRSH